MGTTGSGTLKILDHALAKTDALTVTKGVIQIDGGYLAVKSDSILSAADIAALSVCYYDGSEYTTITTANLATLEADDQVSVTYYTSANYVAGETLYDIFHSHGPAVSVLLLPLPIAIVALLKLPEPAGRELEDVAEQSA